MQQRYCLTLCFLLFLFCLRVLGQALVAFGHATFLPSMDEWFSGAMAYPPLLASQILIILLYGKVCLDFARGKGYFVTPKPRMGIALLYFGGTYLGVMIIRYVLRMSLYPHERWLGGSIPIFFHLVLASFLIVLGYYHWSSSKDFNKPKSSRAKRIVAALAAASVAIGIILWVVYQVLPSYVSYKLGFPPTEYAVRIDRQVPMVTTDGVKLVADIYHPQHLDHASTVLVRIPMSRTPKNSFFADLVGRLWAEHGYTVIIQGTRGRFGSGGTFYPLRTEYKDGRETLKWLTKQSWFNGKIVTWGGSASGYTQWVLADQTDPQLSALAIYLASTDFHGMFYPGGAFSLQSALSWAITSHGDEDLPEWPSKEEVIRSANGFPMIDADKRAIGKEIPFFRDWVTHPDKDWYWQEIDGTERNKHLKAPALLLSGWYDPFLPTELNDFVQIQKFASPDVASKSRLIIGPWAHARQIIFPDGKESENFRFESIAISLPWFAANLSPTPIAELDILPVKIFVMGTNKWRFEKSWPLPDTVYAPYYLGGDGRLEVAPSTKESQDKYSYDPKDPVPTRGGAMLGNGAGIVKQNEIESRSDVLSYTSPELKEDLEVTGPVSLFLYASSSADNTDFTGKLVDVYPNGDAYNVSDGIVRHEFESPVEEVEIKLWPTSMVFLKGHRIRLEVSSSNFPRYDRNPNTGKPIAQETETIVAEQTIHHDSHYASRLVLPVIGKR